jgi:hypothetical protein
MKRSVKVSLYKGMDINKDLQVTMNIVYDYNSQFATIKVVGENLYFNRAYALSISEGYDKARIFITNNEWAPFVSILRKSIRLIQENFHSIFPSQGKFNRDDLDTKELERFQTEKCLYLNGISIIPIVYTTEYDTFPGILIRNKRNESVRIPFEDAIIISEILDKIEPNVLSIEYLKILIYQQMQEQMQESDNQ